MSDNTEARDHFADLEHYLWHDYGLSLRTAEHIVDLLRETGWVKAEANEWGVRSYVNGDDIAMVREVAEALSRRMRMTLVRRHVTPWEVA